MAQKVRKRQLQQRFLALQRLTDAQCLLRIYEPNKVCSLVTQLREFERLCKCCRIRHYHLTIKHKPFLVAIYITCITVNILVDLPIAL